MAISKAVEAFVVKNKVTIDFYGDAYGKNVRARYTSKDKMERGIIHMIGCKGRSGEPMGMEDCIEACLATLSNTAAQQKSEDVKNRRDRLFNFS